MAVGKWAGVKREKKKSTGEHVEVPDMYNHAGKSQIINAALRPLDAVARDAEVRWGIGKLESLADPELAARFEQARVRLDTALRGDDVNAVVERCKDMIKGWKILEKRVSAAGHKPREFRVWYQKGDAGKKYAFIQDMADAQFVDSDAIAYSLEEMARLLDDRFQTINKVKELWPGAKVENVKPKQKKEVFNDDIPF
jgi:hypothetical protein